MGQATAVTASAPTPSSRRSLRIVAGVALLAAVGWIVVNSITALVVNDVALPVLLLLTGALGLLLLLTGLRRRPPARGGVIGMILRLAATAAAVGLAGVVVWLTPALATERALDALASDDAVTITDSRRDTVYQPTDPVAETGLAFYPGGKVDPRAYAVLARGIAERGYPVVVLKCPLNLALLCPRAADGYLDGPGWTVGGHSLGGVEAAIDVAAGADFDGLLFWASYPIDDLSDVTLQVATVSGTLDGLSTPEEIREAAALLPPTAVSVPIAGGIHAFFGDYGEQAGDGTPTISRESAQQQIVAATLDLLAGVTGTTPTAM
jgi:hypothetical protein